jgi:hypothetical protein
MMRGSERIEGVNSGLDPVCQKLELADESSQRSRPEALSPRSDIALRLARRIRRLIAAVAGLVICDSSGCAPSH